MFLQKTIIYHTVDSNICAYICTWKYFRTILNRLNMDIDWMFVSQLVRLCEKHASKLRCASHVRSLSLDETKFLNAFDLYQNGLFGIVQLRSAAKKYFDFNYESKD